MNNNIFVQNFAIIVLYNYNKRFWEEEEVWKDRVLATIEWIIMLVFNYRFSYL